MLLKKGISGPLVKTLQEFLGLTPDGVFGPGTEQAVIKWQKNKGLVADGIIGPRTWNEMGLATTDKQETVQVSQTGLIIKQHLLPKGEYKNGPTKKEFVFLHHTAGWHNPYKCIDQWGTDTRGTICTEFVLGGPSVNGNDNKYDGELLQAFPEGGYGWHLGVNGSQYMHEHSVGIEVCNFGWIRNGRTYVNTIPDSSQIVTLSRPFRGFTQWHRYSDKQITSLKNLILHVGNRDNIDVRKGLPDLIRSRGVGAFDVVDTGLVGRTPGLWNHTNVRRDKFDLFPQQEIIDMLLSL
jgi:hypothetical protein